MPVRRKPITGGALFRAMNTPLCVIGKEKDKKMTIPMALMDFLPVELFNRAFFPAQSVGFVLLAVGMLALMYGRGKGRARSLTMVWVMLTVLGNMGMSAGLVYLARKVKRAAIPLFIVACILVAPELTYLAPFLNTEEVFAGAHTRLLIEINVTGFIDIIR